MTPTYEELLLGATTWSRSHNGVTYTLSHHGHRTGLEYEGAQYHPGIWCYYLHIPEQMYSHRWADFACVRKESGYTEHGSAFAHEMFDTEITWASSEPYWDHKTGRQWDGAKVGCDYNHLWHHERDYPDCFRSVDRDAQRTVEAFLLAHPDRHFRCAYSGIWGERSEFYEARNGSLIHISQQSNFSDSSWAMWLPKEEVV